MTRKTKALSGASQDAYFRRVLKTYPGISEDAREHIVRQLRGEIAQLRVRPGAREAATAAEAEGADATKKSVPEAVAAPPIPPAEPVAAPFDPFAINVVVVLRTAGKQAALDALNTVGDADNLKLLAREQQLSVDTALASPAELSAAIVAAAERRVANRRAAAGSR